MIRRIRSLLPSSSKSLLQTVIASTCITLAATFSAPAFAAGDQGSHAARPAKASAEMPMVAGLVKKVDKPAGKVTLSHGPLTNLGMPAMTMAFHVKEVAWLDQIKVGDRINFMAEQVNEAFTVVHFEKSK